MEADIKPQDMPRPNHPLMQNDAEVRTLGDLVDVRENQTQGSPEIDAEDDAEIDDLDVSEALTFPHKKRQRNNEMAAATDFDADARTSSRPDDRDDASYMTREDVVDSMLETDPDPNAGADDDDFIEGAGLDRAPDITGTVTGINRGMATHLPQDIGRDGFQIQEPEAAGDPGVIKPGDVVDDEDDMADPHSGADPTMRSDNDAMDEDESLLEDDVASDGGRIPTARPDIDNRDEALDATRQLQ